LADSLSAIHPFMSLHRSTAAVSEGCELTGIFVAGLH
jgi:hypothetical protein